MAEIILVEDDSESSTEVDEAEAEVRKIADAVATEVARLARSKESVPTDVPLMLAGLNSITVIQLHFWLQSEYDYEEDMSRLFEEDVSAEVVARDIICSSFSFALSDLILIYIQL